MSTRLTVNRGFEAVAMTVMRYRCSAGVTSTSCLKDGAPVGTKTTSSRSNSAATSLAATRWPWWMGSNVPPITPSRSLPRAPLRCSVWEMLVALPAIVLVGVLAVRIRVLLGSRVPVAQVVVGPGDEHQHHQDPEHRNTENPGLSPQRRRLLVAGFTCGGD